MKALLARLHARLGDYWWYSLMLFFACRAADLLNAFVGLWLVPKYVEPSELGAVLPLATFANFLAVPAAAFAAAFRSEVSRLATAREFGRLRTLVRGVFAATAVFLFAATVSARFLFPAFLERIRVAEGSLALVIIATSLLSAAAPVYTNALQALKKFKAQSLINFLGAPVRLAVMLGAMPFRALTGYFAGQASVPAFGIAMSALFMKNEFSVRPEPYWSRATAKKFSSLFAAFLAMGAAGGACSLVEATVLRQRLPELDSAGYYMATRFSEISAYLFAALNIALFPVAADLADDARAAKRLLVKTILANFAFCAAAAAVFAVSGRFVMSLLPRGGEYSAYWWAIPWLVGTTAAWSVQGFYTTSEIARGRFGFLKWLVPVDLAYPALLLLVTGCGYYARFLPPAAAAFLEAHNVRTLPAMLSWITVANLLKMSICLFSIHRMDRRH